MYAHFYLPRWELFFEAQRSAVLSGKVFNEAEVQQQLIAWETAWLDQPLPAASTVPADVVEAVKTLQQLVIASKAIPSNL